MDIPNINATRMPEGYEVIYKGSNIYHCVTVVNAIPVGVISDGTITLEPFYASFREAFEELNWTVQVATL